LRGYLRKYVQAVEEQFLNDYKFGEILSKLKEIGDEVEIFPEFDLTMLNHNKQIWENTSTDLCFSRLIEVSNKIILLCFNINNSQIE